MDIPIIFVLNYVPRSFIFGIESNNPLKNKIIQVWLLIENKDHAFKKKYKRKIGEEEEKKEDKKKEKEIRSA